MKTKRTKRLQTTKNKFVNKHEKENEQWFSFFALCIRGFLVASLTRNDTVSAVILKA